MTKIQIIEETVDYYSKNPRSISISTTDLDVCVYFNEENGTMCAFSRCCTEENVKILHDSWEGNAVNYINNFNDFLKDEYKGHEVNFWFDIQKLHDNGYNWNGNELTPRGEKTVIKLKTKYS